LWKFPIKIAPVTLHFPEILALKIFAPAQIFFFSTIFFLIVVVNLNSDDYSDREIDIFSANQIPAF
jgi:hypothetical protein